MTKKSTYEKIEIYQAKNGAIEFSVDVKKETIWASQAQIAELFCIDQSVVSRHVKKIFADGEIDKKSNMHFMHIANSDKPVAFYSLDSILAIGYRTNSKTAILFRRWATEILSHYVLDGYTINKKVLAKNYKSFLQAVEGVKKILPKDGRISAQDSMELVKLFAGTWFSLDAYDKEIFPTKGAAKKKVLFAGQELLAAVSELKEDLLRKSEATDLFATERESGSLMGIVGNVSQSFGGKELYPTVEEKAAHLLYFIVKNHPFLDGNKRSGAFAFVWFLQKANFDFRSKITPEALTAITLLVAESRPKDKDRVIGLVLLLLKR